MTDLLTRIRAHVAEIPTHHCFQCSEDVVSVDGGCPNCGKDWIPQKLTESHALALLREVAALEPAAYFNGGDLEELSGESHGMWMIGCPSPEGSWLTPLYTLTGATHAPE